jgi:hypothetical protein
LVILAIFCSYFGLIIWVSKLLALGSADEELFSEMAIQDIKIGIDWFLETKLPEKNITANTGKAVKFQKTANII